MNFPTLPCAEEKIRNHGLIFYDGDCALCDHWIRFVLRHDVNEYFLFSRLAQTSDSVCLYENGEFYAKSTAILRIASHLNWPWNMARIFVFVPISFRDYVYEYIAKRRRTFFLAKTCKPYTPHELLRFL